MDGERHAATTMSLDQEQVLTTYLMVTASFLHPQPWKSVPVPGGTFLLKGMKGEGMGLEHQHNSRARISTSDSFSVKAYGPQNELGSFHRPGHTSQGSDSLITEVSFF